MKLKNLLFLLVFSIMSVPVFAQPTNPTTAPNFTLTDLNGTQHDVYSYLDQGVTVIIDVWATWCGPCINSIPSLESIWNSKGFSATGDSSVMILSIEIDPSTNNEAASVMQHGIKNPVFDNGHTIENLGYNTGSLPTFYVICPDREWSNSIGQINNPNGLLNKVGSCQPVANNAIDLRTSFNWYTGETFFCAGQGVTPRMWIKNMGTTTITSFDLEAGQGGTVLGTTSWTGSLARFESANIQFDRVGNFVGTSIIDLNLVRPNGGTDNVPLDNAMQIQARVSPTFDSLNYTMYLNTDDKGYETSWELIDHRGVVIQEGGKTIPYFSNANLVEYITVPGGGCYELIFYDAGNDGFNTSASTGAGTMLLQPTGTRDVVASLDGNFGSDRKSKWQVSGTYTDINDDKFVSDLSVYPNPFTNDAWVSFDMLKSDRVQVNLIDVTGKRVMSKDYGQMATGQQEIKISAANLPAGMYFLTVQVGNDQITRKVSIQ